MCNKPILVSYCLLYIIGEPAIGTIHLIEGPIGAGKPTFSAQRSSLHNAPHLILDECMVTLFSPDRPPHIFLEWYSARKSRCVQKMWEVTCELLSNGVSVILELGLVQVADREDFYRRVDGSEYELRVYLVDTPVELRRQRVRMRNSQKRGTYKMEVPDEIFELAIGFWQDPTETEHRDCLARIERLLPVDGLDRYRGSCKPTILSFV